MYQIIDANCVMNLETGFCIPRGHRMWEEYESWLSEGNTPRPANGSEFSDVVANAIDGVQSWIDRTAQQNGYDNAVSCVSYIGSSVQQWKLDAEAMRSWRDAVWQAAHAWRDSLNGQIPDPIPDMAQIIQTLPQPGAYGWNVHGNGASSETGEQS